MNSLSFEFLNHLIKEEQALKSESGNWCVNLKRKCLASAYRHGERILTRAVKSKIFNGVQVQAPISGALPLSPLPLSATVRATVFKSQDVGYSEITSMSSWAGEPRFVCTLQCNDKRGPKGPETLLNQPIQLLLRPSPILKKYVLYHLGVGLNFYWSFVCLLRSKFFLKWILKSELFSVV